MALKLITAPASEPLTLDEARQRLREPPDDDNAEIQDLITMAREVAEDVLGRALITQTWEQWLDKWPNKDYIELDKPPLQSVEYIKYYGVDDTEYTLSTDDYDVDDKSFKGRVALKDSKSWPSTTLRPTNGIVVRFTAGYGTAADVPQKVKHAMTIGIRLSYGHYETGDRKIMQDAVDRLLGFDRVWF